MKTNCEGCGVPIPERRGDSPFCSRPCSRRAKRSKEKAECHYLRAPATAGTNRSREAVSETLVPIFDPVVADISPQDICRDTFATAHAFPKKERALGSPANPEYSVPTLDGPVLFTDGESVEHVLTFAFVEIWDKRKFSERFVVYNDDLTKNDFDHLQKICITLGVRIMSRKTFFRYYIWKLRDHNSILSGFSVHYDLMLFASSSEPATKTARLGSRFCNGFAFKHHFTLYADKKKTIIKKDGTQRTIIYKAGEHTPVFCRIKRDDRHHFRYDMKKCKVVDTATWSFSMRDRGGSLSDVRKAWGLPVDARPGEHSGRITRENVEGCIDDVEKTRELFWVLAKEHERHPVKLYPWNAQSPASWTKAYRDALGIRPRLEVQPDFPPERLSEAMESYFGARVEAFLPKTILPGRYFDWSAMYTTVGDRLGLFSLWIAGHLEVEEIAPHEIEALLAELRQNPKLLYEQNTWKRLTFFAQGIPNGVSLPARVTIASPHTSHRARVEEYADRRFEEQTAEQAPFWDALEQAGGKIVPDVRFDKRNKRWCAAGEFASLPRGLTRKNRQRPMASLAYGNLDEITQHVRDTIDNQGLSTSEVLRFFVSHPRRPTLADAHRVAERALGPSDSDRPDVRNLSFGPLESKWPVWRAGPDWAAAMIDNLASPNWGCPTITRAWRLRPVGLLDSLTPVKMRGDDLIDPRMEKFDKRLIELRKRQTDDELDNALRDTGYKTTANGAYGITIERNPIDIDPDEENRLKRKVVVYFDGQRREPSVDRPERPGRWYFPPLGALYTAGARLMLALGIYEVHSCGGEVAYCDTDSMFIVSTPEGGLVPCDYGPYRMPDGTRTVRALSWDEAKSIREGFSSLNTYDRTVVPDFLKPEPENDDPVTGQPRALFGYFISEKSYAMFNLDENGEPVVRKYSAHVIGAYRSPIKGDKQGWIVQAWDREIRKALGLPTASFAWEALPATSQLTLTTWSVFEPYRDNEALHPFDFFAVATPLKGLDAIAAHFDENGDALVDCCDTPRPACPLFSDPQRWEEQPWRCLRGHELSIKRFRTYASVIRGTLDSFEVKRLLADGTPLGPKSRGFTIPRPVHAESKTPIGKEVIVDPTDTSEMLTAEMLSETQTLVYDWSEDGERALLEAVRAYGIRKMGREAKISRRHLEEAVSGKSRMHDETVAKIRAVLERGA